MDCFLGIDVGSVSAKLAVVNTEKELLFHTYERTFGGPIEALQKIFKKLNEELPESHIEVRAAGATGSGRHLAGAMISADIMKNEITAHAVAAREVEPRVRTVIDIGGQDSKIIFLKDGISTGFNMNSVCAAGTGSFLDHQATRLNIPIENFGEIALTSKNPVKIAGRCGVFAESDLISKQQMGYGKEDLIAGLCLALARNYLASVARGKSINPVIVFQGGVAANVGMRAAFTKLLGVPVVVPPYFEVMGALGVALLAREHWFKTGRESRFRGRQDIAEFSCTPRSFICGDCTNDCEISELYIDGKLGGRWGSRCGKWANLTRSSEIKQEEREKITFLDYVS